MIVSLRAEKFFIGSRKVLLIRFARSSGDRSRWSVFSNWSWEMKTVELETGVMPQRRFASRHHSVGFNCFRCSTLEE